MRCAGARIDSKKADLSCAVQCTIGPFARWRHFTSTTRILQGFAFLGKLGLFCSKLIGITKFNNERENEVNSGLSSKKKSSRKWPTMKKQTGHSSLFRWVVYHFQKVPENLVGTHMEHDFLESFSKKRLWGQRNI